MVRLSKMIELLQAYVQLKGDKEVTSIGTHNGSSDAQYVMHLADIYEGPIGSNPYTGRDEINIPKEQEKEVSEEESDKQLEKSSLFVTEQNKKPSKAMAAYFGLVNKVHNQKDKDLQNRLTTVYGALSLLVQMGEIDQAQMNSLWMDFVKSELGL